MPTETPPYAMSYSAHVMKTIALSSIVAYAKYLYRDSFKDVCAAIWLFESDIFDAKKETMRRKTWRKCDRTQTMRN